MNNDQQEPDFKPPWGLKRKPLTNKPKEERIMETVNRMIHRIQNDERNCLCLRMPLTLKEEMTTICDEYQINESDLMRKAIVQFVENIKRNPDQTSRYMFV